jgi:signal transduction histidine kinase
MRFSPFFQNPIAIDTFLIRSTYLLAFAYIFGFLSDFEKRQNQKLAVLYKTASEAAIQEGRRSIAQELHDRLLQLLASLTLRLEVCRKQLMERPAELARELELLEEAARSSMTEIRQFLSGKAPPTLETGRLLEKLRDEMKFLRDGLGLRMVLESEPEDLSLPPHVEQELYYVLREGLINVARHSQASQAELILKESEDKIQASLQDNGIGFDPSTIKAKLSYGLGSMEERIKKLGGNFSIKSSPGKGTTITFAMPLNSPAVDR